MTADAQKVKADRQTLCERLKAAREAKGTSQRTGGKATHTIRARDGNTLTLTYSRGMAIKLACMECLGWEGDPQDCTSPLCPLFPYRGRTMASQKGGAK
jgi:hypothetical protein